jgi:hypothetical protein
MTKRSVASAFLGIVMGVVLSASVYSVPSNSWDEKGLRHPTRFELSEGKETPTYEEVMTFYRQLAATYPKQLRVWEVGPTDAGIPLVAVVLAPEGDFDPENWQRDRKLVFW